MPHETLLPHDVIWRARLAELTVFSLLSPIGAALDQYFQKVDRSAMPIIDWADIKLP